LIVRDARHRIDRCVVARLDRAGGLARAIHVHYAIVLVLGGLAVGLVSGTSAPRVDPNVVLFVFLPPLIYAASFGSSTQDLRVHAREIGPLAVGLVLVTMGAVA
jgi:NhaP-type Na+/H+ or K+/H+ antiporter